MKKQNKKGEVLRKCIGCGEVKNRQDLIRILKTFDDKDLIISPNNKQFGRSFYLCYNNNCLSKILKKNKLNKILKKDVPDSFLIELEDRLTKV